MRNNNVLPNAHFHKHWQRYVRTWFNQPGKKKSRRIARAEKAAKVAPRPVDGLLRPAVRGQTVKYNMRLKYGRGFTLEELKAAGVNRKEARAIGIAVDHRRVNRSEEGLLMNVERLKEYKSRLILFPKGKKNKDARKNFSFPEKLHTKGEIIPLVKQEHPDLMLPVGDSTPNQYAKIRSARAKAKTAGQRIKRTLAESNKV